VLVGKVTIVGMGLLGGSLGLALRERRLAARVVGYVRRPEAAAECERRGAADRATHDLAGAVKDADVVVLGTPIGQMRPLMEEMAPALTPGTVVTDVGSVKQTVVHDLEPMAASTGAWFIGSHPMAGAEKMGVAHARANLFEGALCVITPTPRSDPAALARAEALWKGVGMRVLRLDAGLHDQLVARSSHLPHLVASVLADAILDPEAPKEQALLCANGFRDTTRVASSSPEMWRDIALANRAPLGEALDALSAQLDAMRQALAASDAAALSALFHRAKERRDRWIETQISPSPE